MLSWAAKGLSGLEFVSGTLSSLNVVVTFLAILSNFPKVAGFLEELVFVEIMD